MTINQNGIKVKWDAKATGQRIRVIRGPLSQNDFARKLGVAQVDVSRVERGVRPPSIELLLAISSLSGVTVDYLLTGTTGEGTAESSPLYDGPSREILFIGDLDTPSKRTIRQLARLLASRSVS